MATNTTEQSLHELSMYVTEKLRDALDHVDEAREALNAAAKELPWESAPDLVARDEVFLALKISEHQGQLNEWQHVADVYTAMLDRIGSLASAAAEAE